MDPIWNSWCRLCANEDPGNTHIYFVLDNDLESPYLEAIHKHFSIDVNLEAWPQTICPRCHQFVTNFVNFIQRSSKVQAMFTELLNNLDQTLDPDQLKVQYQLQEFDDLALEQTFIPISIDPQIKNEVLDDSRKRDDFEEKDQQEEEEDKNIDSDKSFNCESDEEEEPPRVKKKRRSRKQPQIQTTHPCSKCSLTFASQKSLDNHKLNNRPACVVIRVKQNSKLPCPCCEKKFNSTSMVESHVQEIHSGEKPFICEECGTRCKTKKTLKEHKLRHTDERPFKCQCCEKSFKSNPRLKKHMDTHNETNYICTSCGQKLNTRRTLKMHMLIHSDQKEHKCKHCGKEFKRAKALKHHLILHSGLKAFKCNFCDKTFSSSWNCRDHQKKIHPVELAAMGAAGTEIKTCNIPTLEELRTA